jgi:hypothetical protein
MDGKGYMNPCKTKIQVKYCLLDVRQQLEKVSKETKLHRRL